MKTYTFVIGSMDDFISLTEMMDYVEKHGRDGDANYSVHEFEAPSGCDEDTVTFIGRGIAFTNDWCADHTFSFLVKGSLDESSQDGSIKGYDVFDISDIGGHPV